jgi:hypothetical protein
MNRSQTLFYATARDLSGELSSLEAQKDLQYTLAGMFNSKELQTYSSYRDIPDLGRAFHRSAVANRRYLLSPKARAMRVEDVPQYSGGILFSVSLKLNEDSIVFSPGGRYRVDVMLYGMVGTLSPPPTAAAKSLYTFVAKAFRRNFHKVREYFVGPEARDLTASGSGSRWTQPRHRSLISDRDGGFRFAQPTLRSLHGVCRIQAVDQRRPIQKFLVQCDVLRRTP